MLARQSAKGGYAAAAAAAGGRGAADVRDVPGSRGDARDHVAVGHDGTVADQHAGKANLSSAWPGPAAGSSPRPVPDVGLAQRAQARSSHCTIMLGGMAPACAAGAAAAAAAVDPRTSNSVIMSLSSCTVLWQCMTYLPSTGRFGSILGAGLKVISTSTVSFGPTKTTSFRPRS